MLRTVAQDSCNNRITTVNSMVALAKQRKLLYAGAFDKKDVYNREKNGEAVRVEAGCNA